MFWIYYSLLSVAVVFSIVRRKASTIANTIFIFAVFPFLCFIFIQMVIFYRFKFYDIPYGTLIIYNLFLYIGSVCFLYFIHAKRFRYIVGACWLQLVKYNDLISKFLQEVVQGDQNAKLIEQYAYLMTLLKVVLILVSGHYSYKFIKSMFHKANKN